jgi:hypothetical protein
MISGTAETIFICKSYVAAREMGHLSLKSNFPNWQKDVSALKSNSAVVHKDFSTLKSVSAVVRKNFSTLNSVSAVVRKYFSTLNSVAAVLQNYFSRQNVCSSSLANRLFNMELFIISISRGTLPSYGLHFLFSSSIMLVFLAEHCRPGIVCISLKNPPPNNSPFLHTHKTRSIPPCIWAENKGRIVISSLTL